MSKQAKAFFCCNLQLFSFMLNFTVVLPGKASQFWFVLLGHTSWSYSIWWLSAPHPLFCGAIRVELFGDCQPPTPCFDGPFELDLFGDCQPPTSCFVGPYELELFGDCQPPTPCFVVPYELELLGDCQPPTPCFVLTGGWIFIHVYSLPTYKISTVISIGSLHRITEAYFSWDSKEDDNFVFPSMYNYGHFYLLGFFLFF